MFANSFEKVINSVKSTFHALDCTGAALVLFQNNELQVEQYWGKNSDQKNARSIQADTKFHLASCRKSYIAFAVAYAIYHGDIQSIDDEISLYLLPEQQKEVFNGITIRHLVTHSHGLEYIEGEDIRTFAPGTNWAYRGRNIELISEIIKFATKRTIAEIVNEEVFKPLNFVETNWYNTFDDTFVEVIREQNERFWSASTNIDGSQMNMYASARELAQWGLLHLNEGKIDSKRMIHPEILKLATTIHSPTFSNPDLPENGFFWYVKGSQANRSEIGAFVPNGAFQILGYTTVTLLVIPSEKIVAVRAFNSFGSPKGYDYLVDVRNFGNSIMIDLNEMDNDSQ
ncbi:serine hydrolase domain-containing protein [Lysinibacillus cavernae]|uniref:serine hydrolase domain-containing protein n=1 Tax=Lysinibacillus cavernae TaxID=2666135 RepID=UPI0012D8AC59|nr:serine hydrolase domain-containing protein [Lysinibacillus cavernae]